MSNDLYDGLGLEDPELQRRAQVGVGIPGGLMPPPDQAAPPRIPAPSANDKTPPLSLRGLTPPPAAAPSKAQTDLNARQGKDEAEAERLRSTGSGISQIQHGSPEGGIGIAKPHRF